MTRVTPDHNWYSPIKPSAYRLTSLEQGQRIINGIDLFLEALAIRISDGTLNPNRREDVNKVTNLVMSQTTAVRESDLSLRNLKAIVGLKSSVSGGTFAQTLFNQSDGLICLRLISDLKHSIQRETLLKPEIAKIPKLIVAGKQGAGKDSLSPMLEQLGFSSAPFSDLIQTICYSEKYHPNDPQNKIDMGNSLRKTFGEGILVELAVRYLVRSGAKKVAVFGPRTMGEVDAALRMNSKLIGVIADPNPTLDAQIRFTRIVERAKNDPSRAKDVDAFPHRELTEAAKIEAILTRPECHLIINNTSLADFYNGASEVISS